MNQPLAYIHPEAKIADNVVIEPFATIHKDVEIDEGTWIGSNVTVMEGARIGKNCKIFPGSVISGVPQDLKFAGEKNTQLRTHPGGKFWLPEKLSEEKAIKQAKYDSILDKSTDGFEEELLVMNPSPKKKKFIPNFNPLSSITRMDIAKKFGIKVDEATLHLETSFVEPNIGDKFDDAGPGISV